MDYGRDLNRFVCLHCATGHVSLKANDFSRPFPFSGGAFCVADLSLKSLSFLEDVPMNGASAFGQ